MGLILILMHLTVLLETTAYAEILPIAGKVRESAAKALA